MRTGQIIAKLRWEKNLGQKELAGCLNLSVSTISNYENDVHSPDLDMLCRLADFFGVSTDYLLGRTESRFDQDRWAEHMTKEYTMADLADTVLSLDERVRESVMWYALFLKERKH